MALLLAMPAFALAPDQRVDNFKLLDHQGVAHELHYLSDAKAVVVMVQGNSCPIVRNALPTFKEIRDAYQAQGVEFLLLNSNLQDNRESIAKEAAEFDIDFPILVDDTQLIGESLGLVRTGEVFVLDPKTWKVAYHGPVDDRITYEKQRPKANNTYLIDALDDMLAGEAVEVASVEAVGCLINFAAKNKAHEQISYSDRIGPMLRDNCVNCHRVGGIGPFAMTDYNMVRGFAPMIREVVRTKRMPPWHADPHIGEWANDRSLAKEDVQDLIHWIEAGAPRGEGVDPLAADDREWPEWRLGEPDVVIEIPPTEVPATGVVDYKYYMVDNPFEEDVWVAQTEILPEDYAALHHVITSFGMPNPDPEARRRFTQMGGLGGYAPGTDAGHQPADTGILLPAGTKLMFQMHYTTYGKPTVDHTKMGIWLHKQKPAHKLEGRFIANPRIRIPANTKRHTEYGEFNVDRDMIMFSMLPHSHFRGIASDFKAVYPDGTEEMLLSVPNYDFNWQTDYVFKEPKFFPAGTKIVHSTTWDNSSQNPANPDPSIEVTWGEQSWEEMLFASFNYRYLEEGETAADAIASYVGEDDLASDAIGTPAGE
jgi:peroxiredoxin